MFRTDVTIASKAFVKQKQYAMQGVVYEAAVVIAKHMGIVDDIWSAWVDSAVVFHAADNASHDLHDSY